MYEERGKGRKISLRTKLWLCLVKLLTCYGRPQLYSFQGSLPRLPLPSVQDTTKRVRYFSVRRPRKLSEDRHLIPVDLTQLFPNSLDATLRRRLISLSLPYSGLVGWRCQDTKPLVRFFISVATPSSPNAATGAHFVSFCFQYLRSVRPLLDDEKYSRMVKLASEFENGISRKLQRYLTLKSW